MPYLEQIAAAQSGKRLHGISIKDYITYLKAEGVGDFRLPLGFGHFVCNSLPRNANIVFSTPVTSVELGGDRIQLQTAQGQVLTRTLILTVSTNVLASGTISLPPDLVPWCQAAMDLSLGQNEKVFLQVLKPGVFEDETWVVGDPYTARTGAYYIQPLGKTVIEGFFGGAVADWIAASDPADAYDFAIEELVSLFGKGIRSGLQPLAISSWQQNRWIQGSYSCAVPGKGDARLQLVKPFDDRIFFAGEATHSSDFSTAHGAYETGVSAAQQVIRVLTR